MRLKQQKLVWVVLLVFISRIFFKMADKKERITRWSIFCNAWKKSKWSVVYYVLKLFGTIVFLIATSIILPTVDTMTDFSLASKYFK